MADVVILNNFLTELRAQYTIGIEVDYLTWELGLFVVNPESPSCTDTLDDYTVCTLTGYAAVSLVAASWYEYYLDCVYTYSYPPVTFTFTEGGQTIYGHYVAVPSTTDLGWVDVWSTPFVVPTGGGAVQIVLEWVDGQCGVVEGRDTHRVVPQEQPRSASRDRPAPRRRR